MIKLKGIEVFFNKGTPLEVYSLKDVDLKIEEGEFVTIIGSNGAGKSTLMNVLAGEVLVDAGTILIDNNNVTKYVTEKRAAFVGRVFQDPLSGSFAELTIEENLAIALNRGRFHFLKWALNTKKRRFFKECLAHLHIGLEDRLNDPIMQLSGGQRQAVSLLMATLQPSQILLLDEHTAALDPKMAKRILALTKELIEEKKLTTLMITHSMHQALELGTRTLVLHQGEIIKDLHSDERKQMTSPELIKLFDRLD